MTQESAPSLEIKDVAVRELATMGSPYNPRKITKHDLAALQTSLTEFGVVEPVVVNKRTWRVVGGHQRIKAAQAADLETLPVTYVDLDEDAERALNLALNRISGDWDDHKLRDVMRAIEANGFDLNLTGFDSDEIAKLLGDVDVPEVDEQPEPSVAEVTVVVQCSSGFLSEIEETLAEWSKTDGVAVHIS